MRTTVDLPDELIAELKKRAAGSQRTLKAVLEDAVRESLAPRRAAHRAPAARLPTFGKKGLRPRVDLDDSAALLDLMA